MGLGDWIIASAAAEKVPDGMRAAFGDGVRVFWSEIFENNPKVAGTAGRDTVWIPDFPGHRPYIAKIHEGRYTFREDFRAPYGKIYLDPNELNWARSQVSGDYIIVEPHIKDDMPGLKIGQNKAWNRWEELLKFDYPWLQIGTKKAITRQVVTKSVRSALAMVAGAKLVITTDGMLHHAAAALGVPAIVLWGGATNPKILGYPTHINVWSGAKTCGTFGHVCPHCREAMDSIAVEQVRKHI